MTNAPPTARVLDLFGRHDPLLGRQLCMDIACPCGSNVTIICAGTGPHAAALRCRNCNRHRQWLSHEDYRICGTVLAEITGRFGPLMQVVFPDDRPGAFVNRSALLVIQRFGTIDRLVFLDGSWLDVWNDRNCADICNLYSSRRHTCCPQKIFR